MPAFRTTLPVAGPATLLPILPAPWLALLLLAVADALWARQAGLAVTGCLPAACTALGLMAAGARLRQSERWSRVGVMTDAAGTWIAFTAAGCVLTYLAARCALPLRDDALESLDHAVGFDWLAWSDWVAAHPAVQTVLRLAYASLLPQIVLCCCVLPLTAGAARLRELFWAALACILVTAAVSALLPALGAFAHHGLGAQADWLPNLLALPGGIRPRAAEGRRQHALLPRRAGGAVRPRPPPHRRRRPRSGGAEPGDARVHPQRGRPLPLRRHRRLRPGPGGDRRRAGRHARLSDGRRTSSCGRAPGLPAPQPPLPRRPATSRRKNPGIVAAKVNAAAVPALPGARVRSRGPFVT